MTLDEKLAQLVSFWVFELMDGHTLSDEKIGRLLSEGIGQNTHYKVTSLMKPASESLQLSMKSAAWVIWDWEEQCSRKCLGSQVPGCRNWPKR
jgi:beta-glucosidase